MKKATKTVGRKLVRIGGWQLFKRGAKMLPFGGTFVVVALVGTDIRRKGLVRGIVNSGLDAIPIFGLFKNGVELVAGDLLPDKPRDKKRPGGEDGSKSA